VAGIDLSADMLAAAQNPPEDIAATSVALEPPTFEQADMRQFESPIGAVDMVMAIGGVMNAIQNLRELELTFAQINQVLDTGKLFIFDMRTIRGLANDPGDADTVTADNGHTLAVIIRNRFSYETLSSTRHYMIFRQQGLKWSRTDEIHVERGYPTQAVVAMLQRTGFQSLATLSPAMEPLDGPRDVYGRVVFVAKKQPG
jgi:hypothetical protein